MTKVKMSFKMAKLKSKLSEELSLDIYEDSYLVSTSSDSAFLAMSRLICSRVEIALLLGAGHFALELRHLSN